MFSEQFLSFVKTDGRTINSNHGLLVDCCLTPRSAIFQLYDGSLEITAYGPFNPVIDIMSIDPRNWDTMTCINQVSEPEHLIPLFTSSDKHIVAFYDKNGFLKTYSNNSINATIITDT